MKEKLTSRKFWALVTVLVGSLVTIFNGNQETAAQVTALITSTGAVITYLFIQGNIDSKK